jgi:hypothetical protein
MADETIDPGLNHLVPVLNGDVDSEKPTQLEDSPPPDAQTSDDEHKCQQALEAQGAGSGPIRNA